jgi:hypothetical protein
MYSTHVLKARAAWMGAFSYLYILLLPSVASGAELVQCCMAGYSFSKDRAVEALQGEDKHDLF